MILLKSVVQIALCNLPPAQLADQLGSIRAEIAALETARRRSAMNYSAAVSPR